MNVTDLNTHLLINKVTLQKLCHLFLKLTEVNNTSVLNSVFPLVSQPAPEFIVQRGLVWFLHPSRGKLEFLLLSMVMLIIPAVLQCQSPSLGPISPTGPSCLTVPVNYACAFRSSKIVMPKLRTHLRRDVSDSFFQNYNSCSLKFCGDCTAISLEEHGLWGAHLNWFINRS